jgi:hypothetical protein
MKKKTGYMLMSQNGLYRKSCSNDSYTTDRNKAYIWPTYEFVFNARCFGERVIEVEYEGD